MNVASDFQFIDIRHRCLKGMHVQVKNILREGTPCENQMTTTVLLVAKVVYLSTF